MAASSGTHAVGPVRGKGVHKAAGAFGWRDGGVPEAKRRMFQGVSTLGRVHLNLRSFCGTSLLEVAGITEEAAW